MNDRRTIHIPVLGDSGSHYVCTLAAINGRLHLHCSCQAGENGTLCKHRKELMAGKYSRALKAGAAEDALRDFAALLTGSALARAFAEISAQLDMAEKRAAALKKEIAATKKQIARILDEGVAD